MTGTDLAPIAEGDRLLLAVLERGEGMDVEIIERIVALKERTEDRDAARSIHEAIRGFQQAVPAVRKTKVVAYASRSGRDVRYSYAPLEAIANAIREPLHANGLSYTWDSIFEGERVTTTCTVRHVDGATLTASFSSPIESGETKMSGPQRTAAALTYARRQSLVQVLGLTSTEDDTDAEGVATGEGITDDQLAELQIYISESGADIVQFCAFLGVPNLKALDASRYDEALGALRQKLAAKKEAERAE